MDLTSISLTGWPPVALVQGAPETLLAAAVSAVATLALILAFAPRAAARGGRRDLAADGARPGCDYLISGSSLKALNEPARALLESLAPSSSRLAALSEHLTRDCPGIRRDIEALVLYGTGFRHHCPRGDGTAVELLGEPRGGAAFVSIRPASEDARALQDARAALDRAEAETGFLRDVTDQAPVLAWSLGPDGQVTWANAAYLDRFETDDEALPGHRIANAFGHVLEEVPLTARGAGSRRRVSIAAPGDAETCWYEVSQRPGANGETLGFAIEADELVSVEASLHRFVETLTETFAHLPIGLAVFDKNRRLGLFNPALTDLVKIDAVWLAGRPSLRDFLERLRETRQMPEQKDFSAWRRKLTELEEGARDGTFEENWVLPSGKIFRVSGRPHPQGALAFLFEDISTSVQLERRYRSELELSQATLDRMSEAVAVFDASGTLVLVNAAFESLWGLDPMQTLDGPGVAEMTTLWAGRCAPSPAWSRLAEFATAQEARSSWDDAVETREGRRLTIAVSPLPDASALVVFRPAPVDPAPEETAATGDADDCAALAHDRLEIPVEAAIRQVMAAIPAAQSPHAFRELSAAAQGLKEALAAARELRGLGRSDPAPGGLPALAAALAARGLTLALPPDVATWPPATRRAALALGMAAAEFAATDAAVSLALDAAAGALSATVPLALPVAGTGGPATALARRVAEGQGGGLSIECGDGRAVLTARLAAAGRGRALALRA